MNDRKSIAIAALVVGILAIILYFVPVLGIILGLAAIIMGALSLKSSKKGFAIAGLSTGAVGLILSVILTCAIGSFCLYLTNSTESESDEVLNSLYCLQSYDCSNCRNGKCSCKYNDNGKVKRITCDESLLSSRNY